MSAIDLGISFRDLVICERSFNQFKLLSFPSGIKKRMFVIRLQNIHYMNVKEFHFCKNTVLGLAFFVYVFFIS